MNKVIRQNPALIGKTPTPAQKLINTSNKLGLTGIKDQQGTGLNIFDTVVLNTNTDRQTLNFFANTSNKSRTFTNLQQGFLTAGEALSVQNVSFYLVSLSSSNLTLSTTAITFMRPLSQIDVALVTNPAAPMLGLLNISIANSNVVKDYLCYEQNPSFNPNTHGIALGGQLNPSDDSFNNIMPVVGQNTIKLPTDLTLPPNQKIVASYEIPPVGTVTGTLGIVCVLGRFGSIFSAKTTL